MRNRFPQSNNSENEQGYLLLIVCGILFLLWLFFDAFVYWSCWLLYWMWWSIDFTRIHVFVAERLNLLAATANDAVHVSFFEWIQVMNATSGILMLIMIPLSIVSFTGLIQHPALPIRSKRRLNIHSLPKVISYFSPSIIPVLASAKSKDGLMNDDSTENAWALKPEEFAEKHRLIQRKLLDHKATEAAFINQLGNENRGLAHFRPHERALIAVFGLQIFLNDRKTATALLDDLNRSCLVKGFLRRKENVREPLYSLANKAFLRVSTAPGINEWLETHGFVRSALVGLYARDLRLPPARFRWLKGVDRTLWYGLHTADSAKVFVEGAGLVAQTRAEIYAKKLGFPRPSIMLSEAIEGLERELGSINFVHIEDEKLEFYKKRKRKKKTRSPTYAS